MVPSKLWDLTIVNCQTVSLIHLMGFLHKMTDEIWRLSDVWDPNQFMKITEIWCIGITDYSHWSQPAHAKTREKRWGKHIMQKSRLETLTWLGLEASPNWQKKTQPIETEATLHVMRPWRKWDGNGKSGKTKVQRGSIRWPPRNQGDEPATTRDQRSEQVLWTSVDHLCLTGTSGIGWLSESCCILTNLKSLPNNPLRFLCV